MKGRILLWLALISFCVRGQVRKDSLGGDIGTHGALINDTKTGKDTLKLKGFVWPAYNQDLDTIKAPAKYENVYNRPLYSDSLSSSFIIFIKNEVKEHKHAHHSEHITVLEGTAIMKMDGNNFTIKKGDMIFVPKGTWHYVKVTSKIPLKVISVQSPNFDGKDRIFKE